MHFSRNIIGKFHLQETVLFGANIITTERKRAQMTVVEKMVKAGPSVPQLDSNFKCCLKPNNLHSNDADQG